VPIENEITQEILGYLVSHPQAQDTLEGIIHFWLLEQKIKYQTKMVKEAIEELVESGLILEHKIGGTETHYRINNEEFEKIKEILRKRDR
jgi:hypothetical protein